MRATRKKNQGRVSKIAVAKLLCSHLSTGSAAYLQVAGLVNRVATL
jgi:hypothetical protein